MDALECPVCLDPMTAPIFQCATGHSMCNSCTVALGHLQAKCPICRRDMTTMRNWTLETLVANAETARASAAAAAAAALLSAPRAPPPAAAPARPPRRACPHHTDGCAFVFSAAKDVEEHARECIFRDMMCPHGVIFNNCLWIGKLKQMLEHYKANHPSNWSTFSSAAGGASLELTDVRPRAARHIWLAAQGNMHFIVTFRVDDADGTFSWTVQHIGSKKHAGLYTYDIHLVSKQDGARRALLSERCFNDVASADEAYRAGRRAALPLCMLPQFVRDDKLAFKFCVRKANLANGVANLQVTDA